MCTVNLIQPYALAGREILYRKQTGFKITVTLKNTQKIGQIGMINVR